MSDEASELIQHQAEQYRKIQDYERLEAENAKLREALQKLLNAAETVSKDFNVEPEHMHADTWVGGAYAFADVTRLRQAITDSRAALA